MSAQVYDITLGTKGLGTEGFTFSVLGALTANGSDYTRRSQGENPLFSTDFNNQPLTYGVEYMFEVYHPVYARDLPLLRYTFDIEGNLIPSSPAEDPDNITVTNSPGTGSATPNTDVLDVVTGRSPDGSAVIATDFLTAWLPKDAGGFLLRKIATASVWLLLIDAITEVIAEAFKGKVPYELEDMTALDTIRDITINGGDGIDTVLTDGGIRINEPGGLGSFFGRMASGAIGFINAAGNSLYLFEGVISTDVAQISAALADTLIRSLTFTGLLPATMPTGILVSEDSSISGYEDVRKLSMEDLLTYIEDNLDYEKVKENLNEVPGDARLPHAILCFDTTRTTQDFIITPDKINVPQPHQLNIDGAFIFPYLIGADKKEASGYTISFPSTNQYLITPDSGSSSDFYGLLNLRTALT